MIAPIPRRCSLPAAFAMTALLTVLAMTVGTQRAHAATYTSCVMLERDQDPPGGTAAFNLSVSVRRTPCATAKRVMVAFHRCRGDTGTRCATKVLARWTCTGTRQTILPMGVPTASFGGVLCRSGSQRVRGAYTEYNQACLGAAARDAKRPCSNPTTSVFPVLGGDEPHALDAGAAGCNPDPVSGACVFGVAAKQAKGHFALVGDSHALHWRASLSSIAQAYSLAGYSLTAGGCFFSEAAYLFTEGCGEWYRGAAAWFGQHPEVSTVFVTANADTPVAVQPGETSDAIKVDGYRRAFEKLPATVKHIVVLRDTPASTTPTFDCMAREIAAGSRRAGTACALARDVGLRTDTAVLAVRQLNSPRYASIDMSRYFCGPRSCYPVIAGIRVNGDIFGHITVTYMRTLGPYLLREVRKLMARWRSVPRTHLGASHATRAG